MAASQIDSSAEVIDRNAEEWSSPDNWGPVNPFFPVYFSKRDSRVAVPHAFWGNKTLNLAHQDAWIIITAYAGFLVPGLVTIGILLAAWTH